MNKQTKIKTKRKKTEVSFFAHPEDEFAHGYYANGNTRRKAAQYVLEDIFREKVSPCAAESTLYSKYGWVLTQMT